MVEKRPEDYDCRDHEMEFVDNIKSGVIDRLHDFEGNEYEPEDLGFILTENENVNGSWYCSTWQAQQDLSWFFSVFIRYQEWWMDNYGEPLDMYNGNDYIEVERIHCCMMIDAYRNVFDRAYNYLVDESEEDTGYHYGNRIEVTDKFIEDLTKVINENFHIIEDIF